MASLFFTKVEGQYPIIEFPCATLPLEAAKARAEVIWNQTLFFVGFQEDVKRSITYFN